MDWQTIVQHLRLIKEVFDKSYKCLNVDRPTRDETVVKHVRILCDSLERIRVILNQYYPQLTISHQAAAESFFDDVRGKLLTVLEKRGLEIKLPITIQEEVTYQVEISDKETGPGTSSEVEKPQRNPVIMPQSVAEFLNLSSKLLSDFDGKPENLRSFLDALALLDSVKDIHETVAVNLIKTKLKGTARNLISNEVTINDVIATLTRTVKGESVEVISAKLMNVRQGGKNANAYVSEIESLTRSLESAFITDGLSQQLAQRYSTQAAVKAITKNASNERVKLVMESGTFSSMNEVTAKFVNSCTEAYGQQNAVLFTRSQNRGRGYQRGRSNNGNFRNNGRNNNRGNGNNYNNAHGNGNNGSGNGNRGRNRRDNNGNRRNVRHVTENVSGNELAPLN